MATKFLTNLDLVQNQIVNGRFEVVATDPSTGNFEGRLIYNSTEDTIKVYSGSAWRKMIASVSSNTTALTSSESNGSVTLTIADAVAGGASGLLSGADKQKLDNATASATSSTLVLRDSNGRFQSASPSADSDVANKSYVDAARSGLDVKQSVRLATAAALPTFTHSDGVLTASANGALTVDGALLSGLDVGIRILVKDETSGNSPYNGIYVLTDAGSAGSPWVLTRASDADTSAEVTPGMFTFVEQGSTWADSGWILTTDGTITLGSTNLTFVQFSAAGQTIAGNGLTKTGNTIDAVGTADRITVNADSIDIASTYAGQSSITTLGTITTGTWNGTDIAVADGGTGASTASDARTNLAAGGTQGAGVSTPALSRVVAATIGDGLNVTYTIQHGLGTRDVIVQVYELGSDAEYQYTTVTTDVKRVDTNNVSVTFATAPSSNLYRVVITG